MHPRGYHVWLSFVAEKHHCHRCHHRRGSQIDAFFWEETHRSVQDCRAVLYPGLQRFLLWFPRRKGLHGRVIPVLVLLADGGPPLLQHWQQQGHLHTGGIYGYNIRNVCHFKVFNAVKLLFKNYRYLFLFANLPSSSSSCLRP